MFIKTIIKQNYRLKVKNIELCEHVNNMLTGGEITVLEGIVAVRFCVVKPSTCSAHGRSSG